MKKYLGKVKQCIKGFTIAQFQQILREENAEVNTLAKIASMDEIVGDQVKVQYIPSIDIPNLNQIDGVINWTSPILSYLKDEVLPEDREEVRKLRARAAKFVLKDEVLYKRGFFWPCLSCLNPDESFYVLRDIYERACGNHSQAKSLIYKIVHVGYYQPSMQADVKAYVKACDKYQHYNNIPRQPSEYLTPMVAPWPFAQWGLDILGPFPMGTRKMKFLVVGIDYFTKQVEAEPLARITESNVKSFIWKNIVCCFGIPRVLVSDNGCQFDDTPFREFCEQLGIKNHYSSPSYPQANEQVEVAN